MGNRAFGATHLKEAHGVARANPAVTSCVIVDTAAASSRFSPGPPDYRLMLVDDQKRQDE